MRENVYDELPALMGVIAHHTEDLSHEFPDFFGVTNLSILVLAEVNRSGK